MLSLVCSMNFSFTKMAQSIFNSFKTTSLERQRENQGTNNDFQITSLISSVLCFRWRSRETLKKSGTGSGFLVLISSCNSLLSE